jgi:PIN domain
MTSAACPDHDRGRFGAGLRLPHGIGCVALASGPAADAVRLHFRGELPRDRDHHRQSRRAGADGGPRPLLAEAGIEIVPVTASQVRIARDAYRRFGRGNHPASLNFGDCFAYALAKERDLPLLFKGSDFARTDVRPAM